jgi:hypothetical protein
VQHPPPLNVNPPHFVIPPVEDNNHFLLPLAVDRQQQDRQDFAVFSIVDQGLNSTRNCLINQSIHKPHVFQKYTSHPLHPPNLSLKTPHQRKFAPPHPA